MQFNKTKTKPLLSNVKNHSALVLALLFLLAAPIWFFFVAPQLLKISNDFSFSAEVISVDNFFDEDRGEYVGGDFSRTHFKYETVSSEDGVSLVQNTFDVRSADGSLIFSAERLYGVDQITGMHVVGYGDRDREGYLFAPKFLNEESSFDYWHVNYDGPAHMRFAGEEVLLGLNVLRFETRYEESTIDQTEELSFLPGVGVTRGIELEPYLQIWVEPMTGTLIKYEDDTVAYYYDLQTGERLHPWNHFSNRISDHSVKKNIEKAHSERTKTLVVLWYIPLLLGLFGLYFVSRRRILPFVLKFCTARRVQIAVGSFVVIVSGITLFGWFNHIEALTRLVPIANGMNPTTAVCFILLGLAVLFDADRFRSLVWPLSLIVIGISSVRILDLLTSLSMPVDLIFLYDSIAVSEFPARMALYTAISFFCLGLVFPLARASFVKKLHLPELLSAFIFLFSSIALAIFLFDLGSFISIPSLFFAAVHTAFLFFILSFFMYFRYAVRDEYFIERKNVLPLVAIQLVFIFGTIVSASLLESLFVNRAHVEFDNNVERAVSDIEKSMAENITILEGGQGLFNASVSVERDEWSTYVDSLQLENKYPGIQGLGYAVFVQPEDYDTHVASVRAEGFPDYTIRPDGLRDLYSAIIYIQPFDERNREAFGFDMFSNNIRRAAMEKARDTGHPRLSGHVTLVQEIDEDVQPGFLVYVPHYEKDSALSTPEDRKENIIGYVYAAFRANRFFENALSFKELSDIGFVVYDGIGQDETRVLYERLLEEESQLGESPLFTTTKNVHLAGRSWEFVFYSSSDYGATFLSRSVFLFATVFSIGFNGLIFLILFTLYSSRQRAIIYADKITRKIKKAKAKDEAVLASIGEGLIVTDSKGLVLLVNQSFENILGYTENELRGKAPADVIDMRNGKGKRVSSQNGLISKVLQKGTTIVETHFTYGRKDGSFIPVAITSSAIVLDGKILGAVEVFRDITEEKEIDKAKTEFVSLASHQLRTPLSAVNWYTEMLMAGDVGKISNEQQKYLEEIYTGNQRMVALVNALLDVSRLELGTFAVESSEMNIVEIAQSVVNELKSEIQEHKTIVEETYDTDLPTIMADPKLVRMIIQNLMSNAIKYNPEGGSVSISIELVKEESLVDGYKILPTSVLITVDDSGFGIPESDQDKIFSKLFRAENVRAMDTEGTGLGLYIIKAVVEKMNGEIWFKSEIDKGTTFYVTLPLSGMSKKKGLE